MGLWFILLVTQKKNQKLIDEMFKAFKKNDRILSTSGIFAGIMEVRDNMFVIKIS
jgi:preprotein translocase YajC subunit